jgi:uroporphyrinogen III methyltransferase / synthase
VRETLSDELLAKVAEANYVTFTSSSTVRNFVEALGGAHRVPVRSRLVSIGPITSQTARELGLEIQAEANRHDIDGLVDAVVEDALSQRMAAERR